MRPASPGWPRLGLFAKVQTKGRFCAKAIVRFRSLKAYEHSCLLPCAVPFARGVFRVSLTGIGSPCPILSSASLPGAFAVRVEPAPGGVGIGRTLSGQRYCSLVPLRSSAFFAASSRRLHSLVCGKTDCALWPAASGGWGRLYITSAGNSDIRSMESRTQQLAFLLLASSS